MDFQDRQYAMHDKIMAADQTAQLKEAPAVPLEPLSSATHAR